jgi:hypothetical protein
LPVIEAEHRDELQFRVARRQIVEPWRKQMKPASARKRDELALVHHGSQAFKCHAESRAVASRTGPSVTELSAEPMLEDRVDRALCVIEGSTERLLGRPNTKRADLGIVTCEQAIVLDRQCGASPVEQPRRVPPPAPFAARRPTDLLPQPLGW